MPELSLFFATSVAITVAPGPDYLSVLARDVSQGCAVDRVWAPGWAGWRT
ncbi:hypothetical protein B0O95_102312 [Mycetohabitans endofungorum]|uniref:LysE type translocator n=1 Tax=Mycetohabitans endofungorum TaxID=417203 RepID=A0A2P5KDZ0_9BURK|nr:hypothetical protein B0O95_102312 [Mycetohabitans endofungorum]